MPKKTDLWDDVRAYMLANPTATRSEVAEVFYISKEKAAAYIQTLRKGGFIPYSPQRLVNRQILDLMAKDENLTSTEIANRLRLSKKKVSSVIYHFHSYEYRKFKDIKKQA